MGYGNGKISVARVYKTVANSCGMAALEAWRFVRSRMKKRIQINKEYNCMKPCQIPLLKDVSIPEFG